MLVVPFSLRKRKNTTVWLIEKKSVFLKRSHHFKDFSVFIHILYKYSGLTKEELNHGRGFWDKIQSLEKTKVYGKITFIVPDCFIHLCQPFWFLCLHCCPWCFCHMPPFYNHYTHVSNQEILNLEMALKSLTPCSYAKFQMNETAFFWEPVFH